MNNDIQNKRGATKNLDFAIPNTEINVMTLQVLRASVKLEDTTYYFIDVNYDCIPLDKEQ